MLVSGVCDRCGKEPTPFECGNEDFSEREIGYYHIVPTQSDDPAILLSNGELVFKVCVTKEHPVVDDEIHICSECFIEQYGDDVDINPIDDEIDDSDTKSDGWKNGA